MKKEGHIYFSEYLKDRLDNPELKKEYEARKFKHELIQVFIEYQKETKITQKEIAEKMGVKQQVISRFKQGLVSPSIEFIANLLSAMNMKIKFEKIEEEKEN